MAEFLAVKLHECSPMNMDVPELSDENDAAWAFKEKANGCKGRQEPTKICGGALDGLGLPGGCGPFLVSLHREDLSLLPIWCVALSQGLSASAVLY